MTSSPAAVRREYLGTLLLGAAGAAVVLLAIRQGWATVLTTEPHPLPPSRVAVRGQDLIPAAGALGLAALAGLAAVIATRRLARRLVGVLLVAFGAGIALTVRSALSPGQVRAAVSGSAAAQAGSVGGGSTITGGPGGSSGGTGIAGVSLSSHVTMAAVPWHLVTLAGGLLVVVAGLLVIWRGGRWPAMSSRYETPGPREPQPASMGTLWESLSQGLDPTDSAPAAEPRQPGRTGALPERRLG